MGLTGYQDLKQRQMENLAKNLPEEGSSQSKHCESVDQEEGCESLPPNTILSLYVVIAHDPVK